MSLPASIRVRGRLYEVEKTDRKDPEGGAIYRLSGSRGARWRTMRNHHRRHMMFLVNERAFTSSQMMDGVWLTDEGGELRVYSE